MGVKTDNRNLDKLWIFSTANLIINLILFLDVLLGYNLCNFFLKRGFKILKICEVSITISCNLILFSLFIILSTIRNYRDYVKGTTFVKPIFSLVIMGLNYLYFRYFNRDIMLQKMSLNLFLSVIPFSFILTMKKVSEKNNRKAIWNEQIGVKDTEVNSATSLLWRFKISFENRSKIIKRKDILNKSLIWIFSRVIVFTILGRPVYALYEEGYLNSIDDFWNLIRQNPFLIINIIIAIKLIFFTIELTFNLTTSFKGKCTGVFEHHHKNCRNYYCYIITDYENKKEIKITCNSPVYLEGDEITVIYTPITKIVLSHF